MTDENLKQIGVDRSTATVPASSWFYGVDPAGAGADFVISYENLVADVQTDIGAVHWSPMPATPTRASNTTFTLAGDYSSTTTYPFGKGVIYRWEEAGSVKVGMQSIPQTYGAPNTTFTIIGDTMASIDAGTLKYCVGAEAFSWRFAAAGAIAAVVADATNARYAEEPMRVIGADLQTGTAGTTNATTIDINKGATTMFTTKPTLATTVASSPTPFTADNGTSLALGDKVTVDVDAVQTTAAIDLYVTLYVLPTRFLYLT